MDRMHREQNQWWLNKATVHIITLKTCSLCQISCIWILVHYCKVTPLSNVLMECDANSNNIPISISEKWAIRPRTKTHLTWVWECEGIYTPAGWGQQQWLMNVWRKQRVWWSLRRSRAGGPSKGLWVVWTPGGRKMRETDGWASSWSLFTYKQSVIVSRN